MDGRGTLDDWLKHHGKVPDRRPRPEQLPEAQAQELADWMANIHIDESDLPEPYFDGGEPATSKLGQSGGFDQFEPQPDISEGFQGFEPQSGFEEKEQLPEEHQKGIMISPKRVYEAHPTYYDIGLSYLSPWGRGDEADHYRLQLASHNFELNWGDFIFKEEDEFDHSVWRVYRIEPGQSERTTYACKIVSFHYYSSLFDNIEISVKAMIKEAKVLRELNHPNVVRVIDTIAMKDRETKFPCVFMAIVMDYMDGSLDHIVARKRLQAYHCIEWFRQVAQGIEYLHYNIRTAGGEALVVTHMAIAPRNILFKVENAQTVFKLADFEECHTYKPRDIPTDQFNEDFVKTFGYGPYLHSLSAPELEQDEWQFLHARPTDIYSLGMCLCYAMCGSHSPIEQFIKNIKQHQLSNAKAEPMDLILRMTAKDPNHRPTIRQIIENEWLLPPKVPSFLSDSCQ